MRYRSHGPRCECVVCKATGCGIASNNSPLDVCECGDWRRQHVDGTGRCMLGNLCMPQPCQKFRFFRVATVDEIQAQAAITAGERGADV